MVMNSEIEYLERVTANSQSPRRVNFTQEVIEKITTIFITYRRKTKIKVNFFQAFSCVHIKHGHKASKPQIF